MKSIIIFILLLFLIVETIPVEVLPQIKYTIVDTVELKQPTKEIQVTYYQIVQIWRKQVEPFAKANNIPIALALGFVKQESGGDPFAISSGNAYGLMQITQPALDQYNKDCHEALNLYDLIYGPNAVQNTFKVGTWYVKWCISLAKDLSEALRYYNVGIGAAKKDSTAGLKYANMVLKHKSEIEKLIGTI
jgi:soluble lytic murein transglycosylase-like protein